MKKFVLLIIISIFSSCYTTVPTTYTSTTSVTRYYFNVEPVLPYVGPYYYNPYYVSPYYRPNYYIVKPKPHYPHNNNYHYGPRRGR